MAALEWTPRRIDKNSGSVDVPAGVLEEVVHHDRVPQFDVIVPKLGVGGELDPVVLDDCLQSIVVTERRQAPLTGELLYVTSNDVLHSVLLEGAVLVPNHLELPVDLPQQESPLDELKWHVVELEDLEITTHEPRISIGTQLSTSYLRKPPTADLDDQPRDVESEKIDNFVKGCRPINKITAA